MLYTRILIIFRPYSQNVTFKPRACRRRRVTQVGRPTQRTKLLGCARDKLFSTLPRACRCRDNVLSLVLTPYVNWFMFGPARDRRLRRYAV